MKETFELGETGQSSTRGSSDTFYALSPIKWLAEIVDAAKKRHYFAQFAYQTTAGPGTKDVIIPYRTYYKDGSTYSIDTSERTSADITWTTLDNLDGVTVTPAIRLAGVAITNHAIRTNALDLLARAKEELIYAIGDKVDTEVRDALISSSNEAGSTTRGSQVIYGGSSNTQDSELADGDTFDLDYVAEAKRLLQSTTQTYPNYGSPRGTSSVTGGKNPWMNESGEPFVLVIPPEVEEIFLKSSQFVNASEYGSDKVIHTGEIGEYLGIKIVVSPNVKTAASSTSALDGSGGTTAAAIFRCVMFKARKAVALAWGMKPKLTVFEYPNRAEQRIALETAYAAKAIHTDAIVMIDVSQS